MGYSARSLTLPVPNTFFRQETGRGRLAIVFPGRGYTCQGPLLYYAVNLALDGGCDVLQVEYKYGEAFDRLSEVDREHRFEKDVLSAFDGAISQREYGEIFLIGKSLGTRALGLLLTRRKERIARFKKARLLWLTPLFSDDEAFSWMKTCDSPSLYVTGSSDRPCFVRERVDQLARADHNRIMIIQGGDHSLDIDGDARRSIAELGRMIDGCGDFFFND